jgi:putative FmdB family regulatory protein
LETDIPIYSYVCPCGKEFDRFLKLYEYDKPQVCQCGQKIATKVIKPTAIHVDVPAYQSPASGKWINGRAERREDLKATGCVEYDPSMKEEHQRRLAAEDAALDKKVEDHVEKEILSMPAAKRERLAAEVENLDVDLVRV